MYLLSYDLGLAPVMADPPHPGWPRGEILARIGPILVVPHLKTLKPEFETESELKEAWARDRVAKRSSKNSWGVGTVSPPCLDFFVLGGFSEHLK